MDEKCAPSKTFKDGSCLSLKSLKDIGENYNKKNQDKIKISDNKTDLVEQLEKKLAKTCDNQTCWLRLDVVQGIENEKIKEEIEENTFRPEGPKKKYEWLSTTDINSVIAQYQEKYKNFLFLGAVPADFEDLPVLGISNLNFEELEKEGKTKIGLVINLDDHTQGGSHWVGLFTDLQKNQIYYFDSFAKKPSNKTRKFINRILKYLYKKKYDKSIKINKLLNVLKGKDQDSKLATELTNFDIRYNTVQHQLNNSECGVYSTNFIIRSVDGESFDDITKNINRDDKMNKCRGVYFRNVEQDKIDINC
jgi:hypothetical protein